MGVFMQLSEYIATLEVFDRELKLKGRCSCKGYAEELFVAQCLHQVSDSMYPAWY